tara:strand:+ start:99 stop:2057 length:1959 start_codon:yes stop_codon:yes gene_type:complete
MKKLILLSALFIFTCSSDNEGNPCIYEPTLSTETVTDITETSATLNGIIAVVSENCNVPSNTEQGFVYSTEMQPTLEDIQVNVNGDNISTTIEDLTPNTTYYVRSFLTNNLGDFYGNEMDFTTSEIAAGLSVSTQSLSFGEITERNHSDSQVIVISVTNLTDDIVISTTTNYEVSLDDSSFSSEQSASAAESVEVFVRFSPESGAIGEQLGTLTIESLEAENLSVSLSGIGLSAIPEIISNRSNLVFSGETQIFTDSYSIGIIVSGQFLTAPIDLSVSGPFEISSDDVLFSSDIQIPSESANNENTVFVHFSPTEVGSFSGTITLQSTSAPDVIISLSGIASPTVHNYITYQDQPLGFGGGFSQSNSQVFNLHQDISNVSQIKMFLQIDCPSTGCDDWDRFANIKVKDDATGNWFEIGRYITPYWVGTQLLNRGLEFDVTDFKSLLSGPTELRIYIENWTTKADLITLEFDYVEGIPDYPYYAVSEVLGFHANSIDGVPYGISHNRDLDKTIQIPNNAESTHLRTLISGWGHATPTDANGRPCAEWCYRTHDVKINGVNTFQHNMGPIGCDTNPIYNQSPGNWMPDRAGWCPGMVVPVRSNDLGTSFNGTSFTFEYDFKDWTSDGQGGNAYYATSTYVVVKSNTEISSPFVN